ncbi:hypothetical protein ABPG73_005801 [Tetrahymena malaccensis]
MTKKQMQIIFTLRNELQKKIDKIKYDKQNVNSIYEKTVQNIIDYDAQVDQVRNFIDESIHLKLNILLLMKQKQIDLISLQVNLKLLLDKRTKLIDLLQKLISINQLNGELYSLYQIYSEILAFTNSDIQLYTLIYQKISSKNQQKYQFFKYANNKDSCAIISQFKSQQNQIQSVSHNFQKIFGFNSNHFLKQPITKLMPAPYADAHSQFVTNFLQNSGVNSNQSKQKSHETFALKQGGYIIQVQIEIKFYLSINEHFQGKLGFALYLQQINKDKLHILYDSQTSKVISMSKKVHKYFFQAAEDFHKINLLSYFPVVEKTLNKFIQKYKKQIVSSNNKQESMSQNSFQNNDCHELQNNKIQNLKNENQIESDNCNKTNSIGKQNSKQAMQSIFQYNKCKKAKYVQQKFQDIISQNCSESQEKLIIKTNKKVDDIIAIQYLLVCKNKDYTNTKKEQTSPSQKESNEQIYLILNYDFYILDFRINSVKSQYLTHLKYIEISNYRQINPLYEASLILDIFMNASNNLLQSNINNLQKNQLERLIQELQLLRACNLKELLKSIKFNQDQNNKTKKLFKKDSSDNMKNDLYQLNSMFQLQQKQQSNESNNCQVQVQNSLNNLEENQIIRLSQQQLEQEIDSDLFNQTKQNSLQKLEIYNQTLQIINKQSSYDQQETRRAQNYIQSSEKLSQNELSYGQDRFVQIIKENDCNNSYQQIRNITQDMQNKNENQISSRQDLSKTSRFPIIFSDINLTLQQQNSNRQIVSYTGSFNTNAQSPCISTTQKSFLNNIKQSTLQNLIKSQKSSQEAEQPQNFSSLVNQNENQSRKNNKANEKNQDFFESSSNHSKSSSTTSNVRYYKNIILSKKRLFTIQFVNLFGILSLLVIIIVILQQYLQDSQNFNDFQEDMNVVGWPTDYMNTLSLIVKNFNLQKLLAYNDLIIKDGDLVKQQIHKQCQTEIVYAVNQIKNLTNQMEHSSNQRKTFNQILEQPNVFRFGSNFNTHIPLNKQPADTYYQLVDQEMGLFYSLELLIIYLYRFAYGLGLGSGQFITLSNKQNIDEKLETISSKSLSQMIDSVNTIQDNLTKVLIVLIIVIFCCIFLTIPLYWLIQIKKQQILQLFGTFHQSTIQQEIQSVFNIAVNKYKSKSESFIILINQMKSQFYDLKLEKKQIVSSTSKLNKFSFKITFLAAFLFCLTLPYPIIDQYLCKNYIAESKAVLKMLKQLYEVEQLIIENTGIHYFCIFLRITQSTFPYKYEDYKQEVQQNLISSKTLRQNLQSSLENMKAASLYKKSEYEEFFFELFEKDICQVMKDKLKYFVSGFEYSYEECQTIYNHKFSQGLTISLSQYFSYFPDLYEIYEISDHKKLNIVAGFNIVLTLVLGIYIQDQDYDYTIDSNDYMRKKSSKLLILHLIVDLSLIVFIQQFQNEASILIHMSVIAYDDHISKIEDLIQEAIQQKLNILFTMKQKYIDLIQLQSLLKNFLKTRKQIISFIQSIAQLNFVNVKLQNLISIYLKTLAFTENDVKLNDQILNNYKYYNKILNQYASNKEACVIISQFKNEKELIIKNVSYNFRSVFNSNQNDYLDQSISKLMPIQYERVHGKYVENYLNTQDSSNSNLNTIQTFALTQNQYIIPVQLEIKLNTSLNFQYSTEFGFSLYLQKINKQKQYILYDSNLFEVISMSEQIHHNIFYSYQDYTQLNLLSIFPIIYKTSNCAQKPDQSQPDRIKQVQSKYLTHLKYIEISKYKQLNPINSASLIYSFYKNKYKRANMSNLDYLYDQQLEDLFQDLEYVSQLKCSIYDKEIMQTPGSNSQQQTNSSCQNNISKLDTQQTQDYQGFNKYEKMDQLKQNQFSNYYNKNKNELLTNQNSYEIKEIFQYYEQPSIKLIKSQNDKQLEVSMNLNNSLISLSKNEIQSFQFRGKNSDLSIDNLTQTRRCNFSNNLFQDIHSSQISERCLKDYSNIALAKQDINNSHNKENSQFKLNNFDLINSTESDSYVNQLQNNVINLSVLTQSQTQIQTSQSFMKNLNQQTLQKLIYQNQNKISNKQNENLKNKSLKKQNPINNPLKYKQIFNKLKNQDTSSNSSKCSTNSIIKHIEKKILSEKRQLSIQFVNWFGILSFIILSVVIISQFFSINLLLEDFQSDLNMIGWPTHYMDSISLIVKNSNLQKLLQKDYIYVQGGSAVKHTMQNQSQNEIIFAINQIKNLTNQMEHNVNSLQIFKKILERPNVFRFGANFNPHIPLNLQPADTYFQLIDIEMGLFYSIELIILYLFRFAYGLGLGSGQFITLSNKLPISKQLTEISKWNMSETVDQVSSIQKNLLNILVILIVVVFCSVFLTLPLYSIIQAKKQKLLQLFGTFHSDMIQIEINKIDECIEFNNNKQSKNLKYQINQQIIQQKNMNQEKKQSISSTSQLQKFNFKIIFLATIIFIITLPYPIVIQSLCKDYINQSKVVLQMIESLYDMQQLVIENTGIHYFCIYLRISPNTVPYSYTNNRQEVYQNLISAKSQNTNLQSSFVQLKAAKFYNRNQYDQFFFSIFESDICQIMKNQMNLFVSGFEYNYEECTTIYDGRFSQGLTIALQQYFSYFPDLYLIYEISDQQLFQQKFDKYQKDLDFEQFYRLEKYLVVILKSLSKFLLSQTNEYENYLQNILTYLLIYQFFILAILFYIEQSKFLETMENELIKTKQYLSLLNINFLLKNSYIQNFLSKSV